MLPVLAFLHKASTECEWDIFRDKELFIASACGGGSSPTYALVFRSCAHRGSIDSLQVLWGKLIGRSQLDLRLHVSQVDLGGQRTGAVVALLGLLDEGVWGMTVGTTTRGLIPQEGDEDYER